MVGDPSVVVPTLLSLLVVSALSLVGAVALVVTSRTLQGSMLVLISFAAGTLLGDSFLHILPEIAESEAGLDLTASIALLTGVVAFFVMEKILHWHHSHFPQEEVIHPVAVTNLFGDALHNFVDGAIVAGAFIGSTKLGVATAIAVALHEIPQELGDFGILVHAGMRPKRALALNFLTGLMAVAGGLATLAVASVSTTERYILPFTAGAFVYIASTDLIPELHKEPEPGKSAIQLVALIGGVAVMGALLTLE